MEFRVKVEHLYKFRVRVKGLGSFMKFCLSSREPALPGSRPLKHPEAVGRHPTHPNEAAINSPFPTPTTRQTGKTAGLNLNVLSVLSQGIAHVAAGVAHVKALATSRISGG